MDRQDWLAERRAAVVACYDQEAPGYDEHEYPSDTQRDWVGRLVAGCSAGSLVLDAPCGTGKYFPLVAGAGHRVVGADQSAGMLAEARRRGTALALAQATLQQLPYTGAFDAMLTIDAMENVPPEDWPQVLAGQRRALRPGGVLYLTVEEVAGPVLDDAFQALNSQGQPAVRGEVVEGDVAGYHYYPGRDQVLSWFSAAGLRPMAEDYTQEDGWGYRHFLLC
jgi:ubiquinone/menaquinone biosynthesis C-methylase UbiE